MENALGKKRKLKPVTGIENYPMNIRQALHLLSGIIRRIEAKRLDKEPQARLCNVTSEGVEKQ
jgi:hypothetical protein